MKAPKAQRKHKSDRVPRPLNSFMLFSQHHRALEDIPGNATDQATVLGKMWKQADHEVKEEFNRLATIEKEKHAEEHPGYEYRPGKRGLKRAKQEQRRKEALERRLKKQEVSQKRLRKSKPTSSVPSSSASSDTEDMLPLTSLPYPLDPSHDINESSTSSVSSPDSSGPTTPYLPFATPVTANSDITFNEHINFKASNDLGNAPVYDLYEFGAGHSAQPLLNQSAHPSVFINHSGASNPPFTSQTPIPMQIPAFEGAHAILPPSDVQTPSNRSSSKNTTPDAVELLENWYRQGVTLETLDDHLQELIYQAKLQEAQSVVCGSRQLDFDPVNTSRDFLAGYEPHPALTEPSTINTVNAITTPESGLQADFSFSEWFNFANATESF